MSIGFLFRHTMEQGGSEAEDGEFTPTGSPVGWWNADAIEGLEDGDPVGTWADSSGNGNDLSQSNASYKPVYKTEIKNGLPAVWHNNSTYVGVSHSTIDLSLPRTIHVVYHDNGRLDNRRAIQGMNGTNWLIGFFPHVGMKVAYFNGGFIYGPATSSGSWYVCTEKSVVDIGDDVTEFYVSGVAQCDGETACDNSINLTGLATGGAGQFAGNALDGYIAEIIAYGSALSDSDRSFNESGLGTKWDITVS